MQCCRTLSHDAKRVPRRKAIILVKLPARRVDVPVLRLRLQLFGSRFRHAMASETTFAAIVHSRFVPDQAPANLFQKTDDDTTAIAQPNAEERFLCFFSSDAIMIGGDFAATTPPDKNSYTRSAASQQDQSRHRHTTWKFKSSSIALSKFNCIYVFDNGHTPDHNAHVQI